MVSKFETIRYHFRFNLRCLKLCKSTGIELRFFSNYSLFLSFILLIMEALSSSSSNLTTDQSLCPDEDTKGHVNKGFHDDDLYLEQGDVTAVNLCKLIYFIRT